MLGRTLDSCHRMGGGRTRIVRECDPDMSERRLAEPIAEGRTAEVYGWKEGWVLKLFRDRCSADSVNYEARIAGVV